MFAYLGGNKPGTEMENIPFGLHVYITSTKYGGLARDRQIYSKTNLT